MYFALLKSCLTVNKHINTSSRKGKYCTRNKQVLDLFIINIIKVKTDDKIQMPNAKFLQKLYTDKMPLAQRLLALQIFRHHSELWYLPLPSV
jgi:hypothetical protein